VLERVVRRLLDDAENGKLQRLGHIGFADIDMAHQRHVRVSAAFTSK
jgi:hypothetical protein